MIKKNKLHLIISTVLMLLPIAFGLIVWDKLPEKIAIHWGTNGEADSFAGRPVAVFALPLVIIAIHWLCVLVTSLDSKNKGKNEKAQSLVLWICPILTLFLNAIMYMTAFGKDINVPLFVIFFMGVLFTVIGNYLPKVTQNSTIGIKIKWTLENEENWYATHRLAGKVWTVGGIALMITAFLPLKILVWVSFAILFVLVLIPFIYSYTFSHKQKGKR